MIYKTILTSKGTTTIPAKIREKLGIKPGMQVLFVENNKTGEFTLQASQSIEEVRAINKKALEKAALSIGEYVSGDGFSQFVIDSQGLAS